MYQLDRFARTTDPIQELGKLPVAMSTEIREYDWGQGSPGGLIRRTKKTYLHDPNANPSTASTYLSLNIVNKVLTDTICDGVVACGDRRPIRPDAVRI